MTSRRARATLRLDASERGAVDRAAALLRSGGLVAFPTETVYGVGADGFTPRAVAEIFRIKGRPADKPIILHLAGPEMLEGVARDIPPVARALMSAFWPGPLTLVLQRAPGVPDAVTGGGDTVAVRCPAHPVALELIGAVGRAVAATSANRSGRPSPLRAEEVLAELGGEIDAVLDGGPAGSGVESTIVDLTVRPAAILRPGGVAAESLREYLPDLVVRPVEAAGSPGGRLVLVEGEPEAVVTEIVRRARDLVGRGLRVGVLATEETLARYDDLGGAVVRLALGSRRDLEGVGRALFPTLRAVEELGLDVVLAEGFPEAGLGAAINDRLRRAARQVVRTP